MRLKSSNQNDQPKLLKISCFFNILTIFTKGLTEIFDLNIEQISV